MGKLLGSRLAVLPLLAGVATGCSMFVRQYDSFYARIAPRYYESTENPLIFDYSTADAAWVAEEYFADLAPIGTLTFNAGDRPIWHFYEYGREVGADVVLVGRSWKEDRQVSGTYTAYSTARSIVTDANGNRVGTVETSVPHEEAYSYTVKRYDFVVRFYRYLDGESPVWTLREDDFEYSKPRKGGLDGTWSDGDYTLEIKTAGDQYVGILRDISERKVEEVEKRQGQATHRRSNPWAPGDLKAVFDRKSMVGTWLMGNKAPSPCRFSIEKKTGVLTSDCASKQVIHFARREDVN